MVLTNRHHLRDSETLGVPILAPESGSTSSSAALYCDALYRCYLPPADLVAGRKAIQLRQKPALNRRWACINLASDY